MKVIFITHSASRTGAPILLLHFMKALRTRHKNLQIKTIIADDGLLTADYNSVGEVYVVGRNKGSKIQWFFDRIIAKLKRRQLFYSGNESRELKKFVGKDYDIIFSNTIVNGPILAAIEPEIKKVVTYVHELESVIKICTTPESLHAQFQNCDRYYVPCNAVADNLVIHHGISNNRIGTLKYYIPEIIVSENRKKEVRASLGVDTETFIIGGVGTGEWRKGVDLFLDVIRELKRKPVSKPYLFLWVGMDKPNKEKFDLLVKDGGLEKDIVFIESVSSPSDFISNMDIFLMTSREDPYPLVVQEAAMQEKPIICFEGSGGAPEFVKEAGNMVVPYLDVKAMADEVFELMTNPVRVSLGKKAKQLSIQYHSEQAALPVFEKVIGL